MEYIKAIDIRELTNPGVVSRQLLNPENSESIRVTVTEVHVQPGAVQKRHFHAESEQIWYGVQGSGLLLLADDKEKKFLSGDVVRFKDGEVHGLKNTGEKEFVYIAVTSPPVNFKEAYEESR
ncbi:MAG: cupin domain-containing protein [Clostridia bacterium]|nr:cupin domain-containing protein [Clostridia bacterium]NCC43524.1 cupin domain-containing protein [Clostridia bacterium]